MHARSLCWRTNMHPGNSPHPAGLPSAVAQSNLSVFDFDREPEDHRRLSSLDLQARMVDGSDWISPEVGGSCRAAASVQG